MNDFSLLNVVAYLNYYCNIYCYRKNCSRGEDCEGRRISERDGGVIVRVPVDERRVPPPRDQVVGCLHIPGSPLRHHRVRRAWLSQVNTYKLPFYTIKRLFLAGWNLKVTQRLMQWNTCELCGSSCVLLLDLVLLIDDYHYEARNCNT